ncbi:RNA polymerase sigma factor [Brevibacillus ginsengisoli]|uniref:RNA polymerase sigma factor n=1 Tax=Brevibacillus ginsengisoli TaxID=363854 RepID=UPI003CF685F7
MDESQRDELFRLNHTASQYIQQFLHGDSTAFQQLVQMFGKRVLRIIQKMIYSYHDVQDLNNEVWLKVAQNLHKYDQTYPFHSWLYRLVSNTCIDFLRKKREITMEDDQLHHQINKAVLNNNPEEEFIQKEFVSQLHELLHHLDETDRLIVTLRFTDQLSYDEIGELVGMSKNTVGTRLFRARKQLKQLFEHQVQRRVIDAAY